TPGGPAIGCWPRWCTAVYWAKLSRPLPLRLGSPGARHPEEEERTMESRDAAADALVIFGITGDLAHKMTFRALYRLEGRGLLTVPVIGVALDPWSDETL